MMSKWLTIVEKNGVKVETVIEKTELVEGDSLNGTVYITSENEEEKIDCISLKVLSNEPTGELHLIAKHSFQLVGSIHSKEAEMVPFELIPDDRWNNDTDDNQLIFKTSVLFLDGTEIEEVGIISYYME
ncbi:cysteine synthase [Lysinibacillus sp. 2017]|uniref:sporulation protein n=2 Tax=unclassified Lysinibacillus TaxID=2636778 RepID=UPI000D5299F6|nr:sporulation protein [Lysinibacillus sp. 2017]AWE07489.1 cysteine synthase [Lysinibacillus sp. 2017]TGN36652.1 cysteine synthase [Lysinibacillus sp. S2017]